MSLDQIIENWQSSKFQDAIDLINYKLNNSDEQDEDLLLSLFKSFILFHMAKREDGYQIADIVSKKAQEETKLDIFKCSLVLKLYYHTTDYDPTKFEKIFNEISNLTKWDKHDTNSLIFKGLYKQSLANHSSNLIEKSINVSTSNFEIALNHNQEALEIWQQVNLPLNQAITYNYIAYCYLWLGNVFDGLLACQKGLNLAKLNNFLLGQLNSKKAHLLHLRGDIVDGITVAQVSLENRREIEDYIDDRIQDLEIGSSYNILGKLHIAKGDIQQALDYFTKSYEIRFKYDPMSMWTGESIFRIGLIFCEADPHQAKLSLNQLSELGISNQLFIYPSKLLEAIILKTECRNISTSDAQVILTSLCKEQFPLYEFEVITVLNLVEILLEEYIQYNNPTILKEIEGYLNSIYTEKNQAYLLSSQVRFFTYKLNLLRGELNSARVILEELYNSVENKGFQRLSKQISNEIDSFYTYLDKRENVDSEVIMKELKTGFSEIASYGNIIQDNAEDMNNETPLSFLILDSSDSDILIEYRIEGDESLNHEFIYNSIKSQLNFNLEYGKMNRLELEKSKLFSIEKNGLFFCYHFNGSSFTAQLRLNIISEYMNLLKINPKTLSSENGKQQVRGVLNQYFNKSKEAQEHEVLFPAELLDYTNLMHPIKLGIIKILYAYSRYPLSEIRILLDIPWGKLSTHIRKLEEDAYLTKETEILHNTPRQILYIESKGLDAYRKLKKLLRAF